MKTAKQINDPQTGAIIPIAQDNVISIANNKLSIANLVEQLKFYNCPKDIIEKLEEWMLQLYLDRVKLAKWKENAKEK